MTVGESVRKRVRSLIAKLGSSGTIYDFDNATVTTNNYGDDTSISWDSGTTFKFINSNNFLFKRISGVQGIENDKSERGVLVADNIGVIPAAKDKIVIGTEAYEIESIKVINPIQDIIIAYRVSLTVNEDYTT